MKKSILLRGRIADEFNLPNRYGGVRLNHIQDSINTIRKWFDQEIIISTWKGQEKYLTNISGVDKIIFLDEPDNGPVGYIKKQIYSLNEGLKHVSGDMILESRCDIIFNKNIFDSYIDLPYNNSNYKIFDRRILTCSHMSINPDKFDDGPKYFRISDWFHLGFKKDLEKLSDIFDVLNEIPNEIVVPHPWFQFNNCTCCEQFWNLCLIKKNIKDIKFCDISEIKHNHWDYLLNNFLVFNTFSDLGAINKTWEKQPENMDFYITKNEYMNYYKKQKNDSNL